MYMRVFVVKIYQGKVVTQGEVETNTVKFPRSFAGGFAPATTRPQLHFSFTSTPPLYSPPQLPPLYSPPPPHRPPYRTTSPRSAPPPPGSSRRGGTAASARSTSGTHSPIWTRSRCVLLWAAYTDTAADTVQRPARRLQPFPRCHERIQGPSVSTAASHASDCTHPPNRIDTPGVIDRVSTLFRGHPSLIQGFNTFLPPGYRIECFGGEGDASGLITVTTPAGTVSQIPGNFAAAIDQREREAREGIQASAAEAAARDSRAGSSAPYAASTSQGAAQASHLPPLNTLPPHLPSGPPPFQGASHTGRQTTVAPPARQAAPANQTPGTLPLPPHAQHPLPPSGPSTPSAAQFLASGGLSHGAQPAPQPQQAGGNRAPILEFNHAITFVNKIKTRFNNDPETYKQFLEILQTYQRDTRDIAEVYEQVTKLFTNAPDLLDEFKQFLPENGTGGLGMLSGSFMQAAGATPAAAAAAAAAAAPEKVAGQKRGAGKEGKEMGGQKKRRTAAGSGVEPGAATKTAQGGKRGARAGQRGESPLLEDVEPGLPTFTPQQQTLASPDEVAFFDKVKKFIDDKVVYHEFLKLINLFVQDMIDTKTLLDRAQLFIGDSPEVWATFQKVVGVDSEGRMPPNPASIQGGYGFGGMIGIDNLMVENTPMLDRIKPDMNLASANQVGPSYRQLPRSVGPIVLKYNATQITNPQNG